MARYGFSVRVFLLAIAACGGAVAPPTAPASPTTKPAAVKADPAAPVLDPFVVFGADPDAYPLSYVVPGHAALELDGPQLEAPAGQGDVAVTLLDEQSAMVRVAVRADGIAFALWTERPRLLGIVKYETRVSERIGGGWVGQDAPYAVLRSGALVRVLGRKGKWTQVRYYGALEIDGWIPDDALAWRTPERHKNIGRLPSGHQTLMVMPGTVIRTEPKWASDQLAIVALGYIVDNLQQLDDAWSAIAYDDGDVRVRGYASRHDPPGQVHRPREPEQPPVPLVTNAKVPRGTCLYAAMHGEQIGFLLADHDAVLSSGRSAGWWEITLETPWGPIAFAAQGPTDQALATCGP